MTNFKPIGKNTSGVPFLSRIVKPGDAYGRNDCLINDSAEDYIEFYDARYPMDGKPGQFVSRYNRSTLDHTCEFSRGEPAIVTGVDLDGGIADWFVTGKQVKQALGEG